MRQYTIHHCDYISDALHAVLHPTWCYRQQIYEVPGVLTALLVTYDDVLDDAREYHPDTTWEQFISRMAVVKADWANFPQATMSEFARHPDKTMMGWEGRTIYVIKGGNNAQFWTAESAATDVAAFVGAGPRMWGEVVQIEIENAKDRIPVGRAHFAQYENLIRVLFNFLFGRHLGRGQLQSRTEPGNEGCEIRDLICSNRSEGGFWKDLKDKYSCSEIVVDAKNKHALDRDDLRQLYCYLKPALGFWGFIVCRSPQSDLIHAYNRTLCKNFAQTRGVTILSDEDFRRLVSIARRGHDASDYLNENKSQFVRTI
jgi:hypothetical protein